VDRDQSFLLPPDMASWLPAGHLAWFVLDVVAELDTSALHGRSRRGGAGRAGFDPEMLLALLVYAYAVGQRSSRRIESLCATDVAFRVICAQDAPDHTTIARFRAAHEQVFVDLFAQVLVLCARAGMGRVGVVAIDGTKIAANAALSANRDRGWLTEQAWAVSVEITAEAGHVDAAEDELFGTDRGEELPAELSDRTGRRARIRAALAQVDADQDCRDGHDQAHAARLRAYLDRVRRGDPPKGPPPAGLDPGRGRAGQDRGVPSAPGRPRPSRQQHPSR